MYSFPRWITNIGFLWITFYLYLVLRWAVLPTSRGFSILQSYIFIPIFAATLIILLRDHEDFNRVVHYVLIAIVALAILSVLDVLFGAQRADPLGLNPNNLGLRFVVGLFLSGVLIEQTETRVRTGSYVICILILLLGLGATGSREAYISFVSALIFYIVVNYNNISLRYILSRTLVPVLVALAGIIIIEPNLVTGSFGRVKALVTFIANPDAPVGAGSRSLSIRYSLLKTSIEMIQEKPLFGFGLGTFQEYTSTLNRFNQPRGAHSTYLYVGSQTGLIGLLLLIAVFTSMLNTIRRGIFLESSNILGEKKRMSLLGSIVIAGFVNAIAADVVRWKIFWIGIALALAHYKIIEKNKSNS
ncbi:O-antigen ligase family protein [Haloarcula brevis]|uniref:O-antigen ligase family protein n=1 Tax=Haloarcula brevis TaxID=3111453 RepID=UPI00300EFAC0